jgi:hypothetical protein
VSLERTHERRVPGDRTRIPACVRSVPAVRTRRTLDRTRITALGGSPEAVCVRVRGAGRTRETGSIIWQELQLILTYNLNKLIDM